MDVLTNLSYYLDMESINNLQETAYNVDLQIQELKGKSSFWKIRIEKQFDLEVDEIFTLKEWKILYDALEAMNKHNLRLSLFSYIKYYDDTVSLTEYLYNLAKSSTSKNKYIDPNMGYGRQYMEISLEHDIITHSVNQKSFKTVDLFKDRGDLCDDEIFNNVYDSALREGNVEGEKYLRKVCDKGGINYLRNKIYTDREIYDMNFSAFRRAYPKIFGDKFIKDLLNTMFTKIKDMPNYVYDGPRQEEYDDRYAVDYSVETYKMLTDEILKQRKYTTALDSKIYDMLIQMIDRNAFSRMKIIIEDWQFNANYIDTFGKVYKNNQYVNKDYTDLMEYARHTKNNRAIVFLHPYMK